MKTSFYSDYLIFLNWNFLAASARKWKEEKENNENVFKTEDAGDFPYFVALQRDENHLFCRGLIIDQNYIMTAAHCFK